MLGEYALETVNLDDERRFREVAAFLAEFGLSFDRNADYTLVVRGVADKLLGTGSFAGEILRNIAVAESVQGSGLTATLVSALMQEQARRGYMHYFIFTKPSKAHLFAGLGFSEIARVEPYAALLESGLGSVAAYCDGIARAASRLPQQRAAVVVNCNPFTNGHQALIRKAASENAAVIVFVVSEDKSLFPFADRLRLVKEGTADLANVVVVPAGSYIVSAATFPTYFTREEDRVAAQTRLDISLFAGQIAPRLGIQARYIGDEPYCEITRAYNEAMLEILPGSGIAVTVMPRVASGGEAVSASKVRALIRDGNWQGIEPIVPASTYAYLRSPEAREIVAKIRGSRSRH